MFKRRGPDGSSKAGMLAFAWEDPLPIAPCMLKTINCFFFNPLPSSPCKRTGKHMSCRNSGSFRVAMTCSGCSFRKRSQKVWSKGCMSSSFWTPTMCSSWSYSTKYRIQFVKDTYGNPGLFTKSVRLIFTSMDCPNCLKTVCAPASLLPSFTVASFLNPFALTRVTRAWRMASLQATSVQASAGKGI